MKKILFITTFVVFIFIPINVFAFVVINEVMYNPSGADKGHEWIEIYSDEVVDLFEWKFYEAETNHGLTLINGSWIIDGYAVIVDKWDIFLSDYPDYNGTLIDSSWGSLSQEGENLALKNSSEEIVDKVSYSFSWGADDDGSSLQRKDPNGNSNDPTNWGTGNPTPGAVNNTSEEPPSAPEGASEGEPETPTIPFGNQLPIADAGNNIIGFIGQEISFNGASSSDPNGYELAYSWNMGDGKLIEKPSLTYKYLYPGTYLVTLMVYNGRNYAWDTINVKIQNQEITISEFIPNPIGSDDEEWIEIYNKSDSIIDISNWQLDDEASGSQPFTFPQNTLIAPKNYLVFSRQITGIALNNDKDSVRLLLSEGIVFQEINYEDSKQGQSSALINEEFIWSVPTPGIANINTIESIGGLDREIVYQGEPIKQTTKELPQESITEYIPPAQESMFANPLAREIEEDTNNDLAMVESLLTQAENEKSNQSILNLILMIIAVVLAGLIIGLFLTKLSKKFP